MAASVWNPLNPFHTINKVSNSRGPRHGLGLISQLVFSYYGTYLTIEFNR